MSLISRKHFDREHFQNAVNELKIKYENCLRNLLGGFLAMDWRVLVVFAPLALAIGWVIYNIGQAALQQAKTFWDKEA